MIISNSDLIPPRLQFSICIQDTMDVMDGQLEGELYLKFFSYYIALREKKETE